MEKKRTFRLEELAKLTGSELKGNPETCISGYADLESATEQDVSFLSCPRYTHSHYQGVMKQSKAGVIFISPEVLIEDTRNYLIHQDPSKAFQITVEAIQGDASKQTYFTEIHPSAVIHETAKIGKDVTIGPNAVIDAEAIIEDRVFIGSGTFIGPFTQVGAGSIIQANVTIRESCQIGKRVVIHPGCVIGACGFGFSTDAKGIHTRIKQMGRVVIEDDVEMGSNCVVDRARFTETRIGQGTKLDSSCVIGHNVQIGKHCIICGQSAVAGSTKIGNHVVLAGQCGVDGHLKIDDQVMVAAKSGVTKSLKKGKYGGYPAQPIEQYHKSQVFSRQLETLFKEFKEIKAQIGKIFTKS